MNTLTKVKITPSSDLERIALNRHFEDVLRGDPTVNRAPSFTKGPRRPVVPAPCRACGVRHLPSGERALMPSLEGGHLRTECRACGRRTLDGKVQP